MEQPGQHLVLRKVLPHLFVGKTVAVLLQFLRGPADVPGLEQSQPPRHGGKFAQFGHVPFGEGFRLDGELAQEGQHIGGRFRHLRYQRYLGVIAVAEVAGFLRAQFEDAADERHVVPLRLAAQVVELGGTGGVGAIEFFAQRATFRVLHDRQVGGHVQREFPAGHTILVSGSARRLDDVVRNAGQFGLVGDDLGEGVGGVEQVFRELRRKASQFFLYGLKARLGGFRQFGAGEAEVADLVVDDPALRNGQAGEVRARP